MFGMVPLPRTLEAALRDVGDPKLQVRLSAARDLARHVGDDRARVIAALERALRDDSGQVRATAAELLGDLEGVEALATLLVTVEDEIDLVRQQAIYALGMIGDARAQKRLERALEDARPELRFQAVMAYPRVVTEPSHAVRALVKASRDVDEHVAHMAFRMAETLAGEGEVVDASVLKRALEALDDGRPRVRAVAAVIVARSGRSEADALLVELVSGALATPELEDVSAAIELCGERRLERARAALARRAFGGVLGFARDPLRWNARTALARLGDERARREILAELDARSPDVRTLAVSAVGRARMLEAYERVVAMKDDPRRADPSTVEAALAQLDEERAA
jgi:HEAT repeat protein